jgi:hypothetical protein
MPASSFRSDPFNRLFWLLQFLAVDFVRDGSVVGLRVTGATCAIYVSVY